MKWITSNNTIIFAPEYNEELDIQLISGYEIIIFSNHKLNKKIFQSYANDNFNNIEYSLLCLLQDLDNVIIEIKLLEVQTNKVKIKIIAYA